jgi:hypothetical protein
MMTAKIRFLAEFKRVLQTPGVVVKIVTVDAYSRKFWTTENWARVTAGRKVRMAHSSAFMMEGNSWMQFGSAAEWTFDGTNRVIWTDSLEPLADEQTEVQHRASITYDIILPGDEADYKTPAEEAGFRVVGKDNQWTWVGEDATDEWIANPDFTGLPVNQLFLTESEAWRGCCEEFGIDPYPVVATRPGEAL